VGQKFSQEISGMDSAPPSPWLYGATGVLGELGTVEIEASVTRPGAGMLTVLMSPASLAPDPQCGRPIPGPPPATVASTSFPPGRWSDHRGLDLRAHHPALRGPGRLGPLLQALQLQHGQPPLAGRPHHHPDQTLRASETSGAPAHPTQRRQSPRLSLRGRCSPPWVAQTV